MRIEFREMGFQGICMEKCGQRGVKNTKTADFIYKRRLVWFVLLNYYFRKVLRLHA